MGQVNEHQVNDEPRWEYRQVTATPVDRLMQLLADESRTGWELVSVVVEEPYYRAFLKRALQHAK
jgi:hypothetical protein